MVTIDDFYRDTWAEVDLDAIQYNVSETKRLLKNQQKLFAVVKANAYGHGAIQVAKTALEAGADCIAVAMLDEALQLRRHKISAPILVMGATPVQHVRVAAENDITLTVFDHRWLHDAKHLLQSSDLSLQIHLKLDTGMGRLGVRSVEELRMLLTEIDGRILQLTGAFTHFATADEIDEGQFRHQLALFEQMKTVLSEGIMLHSSNSAGTLRFEIAHFSAVRLGISMYGLSPSAAIENELPFPLRQAISLHTKLTQVKQVDASATISYGARYVAAGQEWIGTLPIGYADGWNRKLTGQDVLIDGKRVPIVGTVCMDQCMVRLPCELETGMTVTLIGHNGNAFISVDEIAAKLGTINYEVICAMSTRLPRIYLKAGEAVAVTNYLQLL